MRISFRTRVPIPKINDFLYLKVDKLMKLCLIPAPVDMVLVNVHPVICGIQTLRLKKGLGKKDMKEKESSSIEEF